MNVTAITTSLEARAEAQLRLIGDPAVEDAGRAILEILEPALRDAAFDLARQAADEVRAQLPDRSVEVVLDGDDPVIRIGATEAATTVEASDLDARITLRLPSALKDLIEGAATDDGDSVNAYIVKSLNTDVSTTKKSKSNRVRGSYEL